MSFDSLKLDPQILRALHSVGYKTPTPIQEKAIPVLLEQETDLVALAQTGTGKTAAFGFPLIQKIDVDDRLYFSKGQRRQVFEIYSPSAFAEIMFLGPKMHTSGHLLPRV